MHRRLLVPAILVCLAACTHAATTRISPPDDDGDGVPLAVDSCPTEPEDVDRFSDEDGCPDADNDGDARSDVDDICPNEPEDVDGFHDDDGCPDPDNDADAVLDSADQCICVPEVYNGYRDEDGCPDCGMVLLIDTHVRILERIYFANGRSTIETRSLPILDAVARVLVENPIIRTVRVDGHAALPERGAMALSEARARAVLEFLVAHGVQAERLVAVGHGADHPIAPGRTRAANEANRRVEFEILDPVDLEQPSACAPVQPVPDCLPR